MLTFMKPTRPSVMCTSWQAFTLIELLVVVSIIAVILAMVLSVINIVRTSAKTVQCANNLRQISMSCMMYSQDNKGLLPGPELWNCATYYWWESLNNFGTEMFNDTYICPESNFSRREIKSWDEGGSYPKLFNAWGGPANKSTYAQAFHGNSYGMNNQITYGTLYDNGSVRNLWGPVDAGNNPYGRPFKDQNHYSMRLSNASKYVYISDKQARVRPGTLPAQYVSIWPSGLLDDPLKYGGTVQYVRENVIQWEKEVPVDGRCQTVRANHRKRANMVFFDGHVENVDPITNMCEQGRNVNNAYTGAQ